MRIVVAIVGLGIAGCSSRSASRDDAAHPSPVTSVASTVVDGSVGAISDARAIGMVGDAAVIGASTDARDVRPVEMAGPYPSLDASCQAAPPCGVLSEDETGHRVVDATTPHCEAVLDPSHDDISRVPSLISSNGGPATMARRHDDVEIRLGGLLCDVPEGMRGEQHTYYVFVHRGDGWWRTKSSMFEFGYNDKYCAGGLYVTWSETASRTIVGIAAQAGCLTCEKQGQGDQLAELMMRVDTTGPTPAVFALLPVGYRQRIELFDRTAPTGDVDCKPSHSAMSLTESWPTDDDVILTGTAGPNVRTLEGLVLEQVTGDGTVRPGHYHFRR